MFLSDLHLSPARPALVEAFDSFCAGPARGAAGVYVLGDLFDTWIGDDQLREPMAERVALGLRGIANGGVPVGMINGNRDFLVGERFADVAGATLLPEQIVINLAGTPTLLLHGDELCTGDVGYQKYRAFMRNARYQRRFLAFPYFLRRAIAGLLRRKSRTATAAKPESILDVDQGAVEDAFRSANVARMIHGHTHRPAHHHLVVDGRESERWVLADWYDRGTYMEFDADGGRTRDV
ncbi:MAG: UDP-2,3-diacylglucosamine diphosphatase [Betaproteobacteria bacterium]